MQFRASLFWETDPQKLDPNHHARYIIERIMDFGNDDEVRWMRRTYPNSLLHQISVTSPNLHQSSRTLWQLITQV